MMKLYELTSSYNQLLEMAEELDFDTFQDTLDSIQEEIEDKAVNMAKLIKCLAVDASAIKEEEERLSARRKSIDNKITAVKEYLQNQMEVSGIEKVKRPTLTVSIQNNPPSLNILDESLIPSTYMIPQPSKISKKEILAAIKSGEEIFGVEMVQGRSVRIR